MLTEFLPSCNPALRAVHVADSLLTQAHQDGLDDDRWA